MTDIERNRVQAICEVGGVSEIDDLSDGFHTFRQLYYQRMMLFATIVKQNKDRAWKSLRHEDGELCFGGGWFIVGIDTPEGSYTYHYEDNFYSLFDCKELECAKHWDGHTEKDVTRLLSLPVADATGRKANNFDIHNVKFSDKDYPLPMLLVDGKENYSLISLDGVILVPLYQVIDKLTCVKPDEILRNGKRICPNCGADMREGRDDGK